MFHCNFCLQFFPFFIFLQQQIRKIDLDKHFNTKTSEMKTALGFDDFMSSLSNEQNFKKLIID